MRRGIPPITNILDMLPANLREEVLDDARTVIGGLEASGLKIVNREESEEET